MGVWLGQRIYVRELLSGYKMSHKQAQTLKVSRIHFPCALRACLWPAQTSESAWLLLYRFHVGHQRPGLVFGNAFLFVAGHVGWLLYLLSLEHNLNQVCVSYRSVKLLFGRPAMTGDAFPFVTGGGIKIIWVSGSGCRRNQSKGCDEHRRR